MYPQKEKERLVSDQQQAPHQYSYMGDAQQHRSPDSNPPVVEHAESKRGKRERLYNYAGWKHAIGNNRTE